MKKKTLTLVYIGLLGLILRLITINQSFWLDEATSGLVVRNYDYWGIINEFSVGDFHPPFYYLLLKAWAMIGGTGEIWLRGLSVFFGVGTVGVVYLVGKELNNITLAKLSALLMATAPLHVYYSQEARMYSMGAFLVSLAVYYFLRIIKTKADFWDWVGFGVCLALMLWTDYLLILVIPVFWIWGWRHDARLDRRKFLWSHVPLGVVAALWWDFFRQQLESGLGVRGSNWWGHLGAFSLKNLALIPVKFMVGRVGFENKIVYAAVVLSFGLMVVYLLRLISKKMGNLLIVWMWLVVPLVLGVGLSFLVPVLTYFRFIFVLPALYILLAEGLLRIKQKYFLPALVILLTANFLFLARYYQNSRFHRENWRGLVEYVRAESVENSRVVFVADSQMEGYKYYRSEADLAGPGDVDDSYDEVWLMRYVQDIFDPGDEVRRSIEELGYKKASEHDFNGVVVWRYKYANRD